MLFGGEIFRFEWIGFVIVKFKFGGVCRRARDLPLDEPILRRAKRATDALAARVAVHHMIHRRGGRIAKRGSEAAAFDAGGCGKRGEFGERG